MSQAIINFLFYLNKTFIFQKFTINSMMEDTDIMMDCPEGFDAPEFTWDKKKCAKQLTLNDQCLRCLLKSGSGFKTVLGSYIFKEGGKYYFQIFINRGQLFKIGVARPNYEPLNEAFSDTLSGWAIYNGETRHNSNSDGQIYGSKLKSGDIIGVALDMIAGTLEYYRNGEYWGVAFKDQQLRMGQLVAAVSPITVNDVFTLRSLIKQD